MTSVTDSAASLSPRLTSRDCLSASITASSPDTGLCAAEQTLSAVRYDSMSAKGAIGPTRTHSKSAELISDVLENCISQAEVAATLSAVLQSNCVSGIMNQELRNALQEHQLLEEKLGKLEDLKTDGEQEGEAVKARKQARAQLERNIKNSFRDVLRLCQANPDAISGLRAELGIEIVESENILIRELKLFHSNMVRKLLTSPDEELPPGGETQNLEEFILLEEELAENIKKIDAQIENVMESIESVQQKNKALEEEMSLPTEKQRQPQIKTASLKQTSLQEEIDQLNIQLSNLMFENRQAERILQEKNEKVEMEIEYLIQNFDEKITETQANLEMNETSYRKEKEDLRKLEELFSVLEVECNQIQERHRQAEEKRLKEMKELELKTKAAIIVQAWWRGYSTRKAIKNKGKGKKAKKSKGKKTKKSKGKKTK
uniref:Dynein regulatory complex protein 10 n=3 Tax=Amphiprion ocellaris TaxID=80972 RepID=A0A3Q1B8H6_AMPOC